MITLVETHDGQPLTDKTYRCCVCGLPWIGMGNNAWPIGSDNERCCNPCDVIKVLPARLEMHRAWRAENERDGESD